MQQPVSTPERLEWKKGDPVALGYRPATEARTGLVVLGSIVPGLPNVPVRRYVLSVPFELRGLAATKPDVSRAMGRIFAEEIARVTKRLAGVDGAISSHKDLAGA
jgi:hypothetical protein